MTSTIYTIGFTQKSAEEFFKLLKEARVRKVIDIRENRIGHLAGFARHPDISFFLERVAGIEYEYQPLLAPNPEIRLPYRKTRDWEQYERSFLELMQQRKVLEQLDPSAFEGNVVLLCSEAQPEMCHRRLVAEMLAEHWNARGHSVLVKHLVLDKRPARRKPRRSRHAGTDPL